MKLFSKYPVKMSKRKFDVKLRKVGNSYVVTIPMDMIERFELSEGDFIAIDIDTQEIKKFSNKENFSLSKSANPKDFEIKKKKVGEKNDK